MAAAYGALVSVMQIVNQLQNHPFPPISLDIQQAQSLTQLVSSSQEFLEGYKSPFADGDEADPLEMRIADAAYAAEDVIESNIIDRILPDRSENQWNMLGFFNWFRSRKEPEADAEEKINFLELYQGLQKVIKDMMSIKKEAMEIVADQQLQRQVSASSSSSSLTRLDYSSRPSLTRLSSSTNMVGCDDASLELMDKLTGGYNNRQIIPIVGMGGIGKTTLAGTVYSQPLITEYFDVRMWSTISQVFNPRETLRSFLCQARGGEASEKNVDKIGLELHKYLFGRRFLIVLDDMWSIEAWDEIQRFFPENGNGSRVLVTTRLSTLASQLDNTNYCLKMDFLDEGSSWELFSKSVFGDKSFPHHLMKIGKEIVEDCGGLPLSIVVMGGLLERLEPTKECWESIRRNLNSVVNSEINERCLKILKMSYNHLPVYLKPCFLYLGTFKEDTEIRVSTVIKLWVSEGFLKPASEESLETTAEKYLKELVDRNLIQAHTMGSTGKLKYCKIHDLLRDICLRESQKERFYYVVRGLEQHVSTPQRRIVVSGSASEVQVVDEAMEFAQGLRSYLSDGDGGIDGLLPRLRSLRTLKTNDGEGSERFQLRSMPELANLRYLATRVDGQSNVPSSINLLWSLQTLIIYHPRTGVKAPVEIWKMPLLRHVHFCKRALRLPDPPKDSVVIMENLQTLKGIQNFKCDQDVVRRIPNIKKLGIRYGCDDDDYCLQNIECLQKLESLRFWSTRRDDLFEKLTFPRSLKSLYLSGFDMVDQSERIGSLPLLQKLKLKYSYLGRGGKWETVEGQFRSLKLLSLNCCRNLECWMTESSHFPCLERLHVLDVPELKEIPSEIGEIATLKSVVLIECGESAVKSLKKTVEQQEELHGEQLSFKVHVVLPGNNQQLQDLASPNFQVSVDPVMNGTHFDRCLIQCLFPFVFVSFCLNLCPDEF